MYSSTESNPLAEIVATAAIVKPRFFGLIAAGTRARPNALTALKSSIDDIHDGISGSSSPCGRLTQFFTPST
jgi:hypothetical protein